MVGLGGIARRGADAAIGFRDQVVGRQSLVRRIAPELGAHALVHALGEGFREAVGQRLDEDRGIIVVGALEAFGDRDFLDARRDHEAAEIVSLSAVGGRDEIGERHVGTAVALRQLLAQGEEGRKLVPAAVIREQPDIVADRVGRPEADHRLRREPFFRDDLLQHRLRVVEERPGGRPLALVLEDLRIAALELPGLEERRPVDVAGEVGEVPALENAGAEEGGARRFVGRPVGPEGVVAGARQRQALLLGLGAGMGGGHLAVFGAHGLDVAGLRLRRQEAGDDADGAACVVDVDGLAALVTRVDLDRGVDPAGGRAADQKRDVEALALHLGGDVHHLVE